MRSMRIIWASVCLVFTLSLVGTARADGINHSQALKEVRQDLWDQGLWDDSQELEPEEKEILLGDSGQEGINPEELQRALAKVTFLSSASNQ